MLPVYPIPGEIRKTDRSLEWARTKKVAKGKFIKVTLNDQVSHENVEVEKSTGGALTGKEVPTGPILFQGDHGPVAYRNLKITPKK